MSGNDESASKAAPSLGIKTDKTRSTTDDFFARHERFFETSDVGTNLPDGGRSPRLAQRYKGIIGRNRSLFLNARVLDIASHDGRWTMAALDAGARHVIGVEGRAHLVEYANRSLIHYGVAADRYTFVNADIFNMLPSFEPGQFNLIMCLGFFYHSVRHYEIFQQFHRLEARHVILDTAVVKGAGAIVRFKIEGHDRNSATLQTTEGIAQSIVGHPNHEMIALLCRHFGFRKHLVDWRSLDITDWTGVEDYEGDSRRTYVLERLNARPR